MDTKFFVISLFVLIASIFFCTSFLSLTPNIVELAAIHKCPICYGTDLCSAVRDGEIYILPTSLLNILISYLSVKNVYFGSYNGKHVVLKKLAHDWDLNKWDHNILNKNVFHENPLIQLRNEIKSIFEVPFGSKDIHKIRLCPSTESISRLMESFRIHNNILLETLYINIISILHMNPEPLFLQILRASDGWPVPEYIGSCGRISIVEHCGSTLSILSSSPWQLRASVANQLITAAFSFTFNHPQFAFYLTDVSMDNIAVNEDGIAKFVDLEDVIIVDKYSSNQVSVKAVDECQRFIKAHSHLSESTLLRHDFLSWNEIHASENFDSPDFVFSSDEICSHHTSDHNIYAVCWGILSSNNSLMSGGLVHSPPDSVLQRFPELMQLIQWCVRKPPNKSRFSIAKKLQRIFTNHII